MKTSGKKAAVPIAPPNEGSQPIAIHNHFAQAPSQNVSQQQQYQQSSKIAALLGLLTHVLPGGVRLQPISLPNTHCSSLPVCSPPSTSSPLRSPPATDLFLEYSNWLAAGETLQVAELVRAGVARIDLELYMFAKIKDFTPEYLA